MLQILITQAQRLGKFRLLLLQTLLFLAGSLLRFAGGVLLGLRQFEGKGIRLLLLLGLRRVAGVRGFLQIVRQLGGGLHRSHLGIGRLAAGLHHLGFAVLGHLQQFLLMLLRQGCAFRRARRSLGVQFLTQYLGCAGGGFSAPLPCLLAFVQVLVPLRSQLRLAGVELRL